MLSLSLLPLLLVTACFAAPSKRTSSISVPASALVKLPTPLNAPTSDPKLVAVAVGMCNYTCGFDTGTFSFAGPLANVFDASSLFPLPSFFSIQTDAFNAWIASNSTDALDPNFASQMINTFGTAHLGTFEFGDSVDPIPVVDFTQFANNPNQFLVAKIAATAPSVNDTANDVQWLQMQTTAGSLAQTTFLVNTVGGQQPLGNSCNPSNPGEFVKFTGMLCERPASDARVCLGH